MASSPRDRPRSAHPQFSRAQEWWAVGGLFASVVLVYWNSLSSPFLFDDAGAVLNNPTIRKLFSAQVFLPPADGSTTTSRPLLNFSYALNYAVSGPNAWGFHLVNVAIHAAAAWALLALVRLTLGSPALRQDFAALAFRGSFFAALVWAVHPLLTESVTCIAQRTESLCALFYFLAMLGFCRGAGGGPTAGRWRGVSVLACLAGMATKEVMVTAPVMIFLYDRTFFAGSFAGAWRLRRGYYFALGSTWILLAAILVAGNGSRGVSAGFGLGVSSWHYLLTQCNALVIYLKLATWPVPLVLDYGTAVVHSVGEVFGQGLLILALLGLAIWALVARPALGFAGAWFFVILSPSSSVVPLVAQTIAEHRMYLPLASLVVLGVIAVIRIAGSWGPWILGAIALALGLGTIARNHDYRSVESIWRDTAAKAPGSARAQNNLGWALQQEGRGDEANVAFARAVELDPSYISARFNWGVALLGQERWAEAIAQLETAVRLAPGHADAQVNLGNALVSGGRTADSVVAYEAALRLRPEADVHYNLGIALAQLGKPTEAAAHWREAVRLDPSLPRAHFQLGLLAGKNSDFATAEKEFTETLRLSPSHVAAHRALGLLFAQAERLGPAGEHFQAAITLQPTDADSQANLGNVLLMQGDFPGAIRRYEEALRLRPGDARTAENLAVARESLRAAK